MVMVQRQQAMSIRRQSSAPGTLGSPQPTSRSRGSFSSCAMGDEDDNYSLSSVSLASPDNHSSSTLLPSTFGGRTSSSRRSSFGQHRHNVKAPRWVLGVLCLFTAFSWIRAVQSRTASYEVLAAMNIEMEGFELHKQQSQQLLDDATDTMNVLVKKKWKLKRTTQNFEHEKRMLEELAEAEAASAEDNVPIPEKVLKQFQKRKTSDVAKQWVLHRQESLLHKIYNLQAFVQEESRRRVIEKYGPGPHHVVFDVKTREGRKPGKLIVRMAPLSTVPHAIETFLDLVDNKIWDNTLFYSHHSQSHVVAAAPVSYGTFKSKEHEMQSLGFSGVSFPEYSEEFPHKKYTLGFAATSTNFYINAMDNEEHHGPKSEENQHELEGDADPCFAEIVSGKQLLADIQYNRHKGDTPKGWSDYDLTRITSATLQDWP